MKHSFWNWFFVVCSLSTLRGCPLLAQDAAPNVVIGSTTVRIGMSVDAVTTQLQARFQTSNHPSKPVSQVWVLVSGKELPFAVLYVRNQVVVGVEHEILERESESANDIFDALFMVSSKLMNEHKNSCHIETGTGYLPDAHLSKAYLNLTCGPYRVVLLKNEFKSTDGKLIDGFIAREELGDTD